MAGRLVFELRREILPTRCLVGAPPATLHTALMIPTIHSRRWRSWRIARSASTAATVNGRSSAAKMYTAT